VEVFSIDEAFIDITNTADRFGGSVKLAQSLKAEVRAECGEWMSCSIGISYNKLLAKLAGEIKKPDGLTVISEQNRSTIFAVTPIENACGIGWALTPKLNNMGINTLLQLSNTPLSVLVEKFGSYGYRLRDIGLGVDEDEVHPYWRPESIKSIGHQFTFQKDTTSLQEISQMLFKLSELVAKRSRQQGKLGKTIHLWFRSAEFKNFGKQITLPQHTQDGMTIYYSTLNIWNEAHYPSPIRLVGVTLTNLRDETPQQLSLLPEVQTRQQVIEVVDRINQKYGAFTIQQGALLGSMRIKRNANGYGSDFKRGKTDLLG